MTDLENEKQGYSAFERIMFFVTPILFTLVLLGVLLTLFNFDLRNKALDIGNSIPLLKDVLPDAQTLGAEGTSDEELRSANLEQQIEKLEAELAAKDEELAEALEAKTEQDKELADLKAENDQLKLTAETAVDEEYEANVKELANVYAKMSPSKAAPILETMSVEEMAFVLGSMAPNSRAKILEKMTPETAAEVTMQLKNAVTSKDLDISALQEELKKAEAEASAAGSVAKTPSSSSSTPSTLADEQLGETFAAMDAASAGKLLVSLAGVSPSKVLRILKAVDDTTRSALLAEMAGENEQVAADLTAKLMSGK